MAKIRSYTDVIKHPIMTEKSYAQMQNENTYTFAVMKEANKELVKQAVSAIFDVKVDSVNIINTKPKKKRMGRYEGTRKGFKKAIIKLAPGQVIGGENQEISKEAIKEASTKDHSTKADATVVNKATKQATGAKKVTVNKMGNRGS